MGLIYDKLLRPALFRMDAEHAHEVGVDAMAVLGRFPPLCRIMEAVNAPRSNLRRPLSLFGLDFPNAVGLAAGFDKNARAWPAAAALGFGHVEIGTVTALAQPGNPRPRVFRYPEARAVINRMGFNNDGAQAVAARLSHLPSPGRRRIPLGINLGKSKVADIDQAAQDYLTSFGWLADYADYLVLNVSSPNTPGLRTLQDDGRLRELLKAVTGANKERSAVGKPRVPLLLKIAPDLSFPQLDAVLTVLFEFGLDGIIATNTTLARPEGLRAADEAGGLSGAPLRRRSMEIISYISKATDGRLPIIGVGGISDPESASEKMDAGASLLQIYTGLIYGGPFFPALIARSVSDRQR